MELLDKVKEIQMAYWKPNLQEKEALLSKFRKTRNDMPWGEKFRLFHLVCLDMLSDENGKLNIEDDDTITDDVLKAQPGENLDLARKLLKELLGANSPYRAQRTSVYQGEPRESIDRKPDMQGFFRNASVTHIGSLEVLRLDDKEQPVAIDFVPLDDLTGAIFSPPALIRYAKLFYNDRREDEVVMLPIIYGMSWACQDPNYRNGLFTQFICDLRTDSAWPQLSIGIGHQDFYMGEKGETLFGFSTIGEFSVDLCTDDPRFEEKCRALGIDPDEFK